MSSFVNLPYVPLIKILTYLSINERLTCMLVCKTWRNAVLSPALWKTVYPIEWANGHWANYIPDEVNGEENLVHGSSHRVLVIENRAYRPELHGNVNDIDLPRAYMYPENDTFKGFVREYTVFAGFLKNMVPHIGVGIQKCVLASSGVVKDSSLRVLLLSCPNLAHLDVSFTSIGNNSFDGLWKFDACMNLKHLNFTSCYNLTDGAIANLVKCWTFLEETEEIAVVPCIESDIQQAYKQLHNGLDATEIVDPNDPWNMFFGPKVLNPVSKTITLSCSKGKKREVAGLSYLNLSGCTLLNDESLHSLLKCKKALQTLEFLDVSGNCHFTCSGLFDLVESCPNLKPENMYYCDSLTDGPFNSTANGCSNLQSSTRPCCIPLEL